MFLIICFCYHPPPHAHGHNLIVFGGRAAVKANLRALKQGMPRRSRVGLNGASRKVSSHRAASSRAVTKAALPETTTFKICSTRVDQSSGRARIVDNQTKDHCSMKHRWDELSQSCHPSARCNNNGLCHNPIESPARRRALRMTSSGKERPRRIDTLRASVMA